MEIRLNGSDDELQILTKQIQKMPGLDIKNISDIYPNRRGTQGGRVYIQCEIDKEKMDEAEMESYCLSHFKPQFKRNQDVYAKFSGEIFPGKVTLFDIYTQRYLINFGIIGCEWCTYGEIFKTISEAKHGKDSKE